MTTTAYDDDGMNMPNVNASNGVIDVTDPVQMPQQ